MPLREISFGYGGGGGGGGEGALFLNFTGQAEPQAYAVFLLAKIHQKKTKIKFPAESWEHSGWPHFEKLNSLSFS